MDRSDRLQGVPMSGENPMEGHEGMGASRIGGGVVPGACRQAFLKLWARRLPSGAIQDGYGWLAYAHSGRPTSKQAQVEKGTGVWSSQQVGDQRRCLEVAVMRYRVSRQCARVQQAR